MPPKTKMTYSKKMRKAESSEQADASLSPWCQGLYRMVGVSEVGLQDSKAVTKAIACNLSVLVKELAALKADATHWLTDPEYAALRHSLESAHAAAEAALIEARRRVRLDEDRGESRGGRIANGFGVLDRGYAKAGRLMC